MRCGKWVRGVYVEPRLADLWRMRADSSIDNLLLISFHTVMNTVASVMSRGPKSTIGS